MIAKLQDSIDAYRSKRSQKGFKSNKLSKFEMFTVRLDYLIIVVGIMYNSGHFDNTRYQELCKYIKNIKQHAFSSKNAHGTFTGMEQTDIDYLSRVWKEYIDFLRQHNVDDQKIKDILVVFQ